MKGGGVKEEMIIKRKKKDEWMDDESKTKDTHPVININQGACDRANSATTEIDF